MDWSSVDWNSAATGLMVLIITGLSILGKKKGNELAANTVPRTTTAPMVEVAGALVDSTTLNAHTAAIEALNLTLTAGQVNNKKIADELTTAIYEMKEELHDLRHELGKAILLLSVKR